MVALVFSLCPLVLPCKTSDHPRLRSRITTSAFLHYLCDSKLHMPTPKAIDILWLTAGLGCDGDTIAMTAATQPSIEDIVLGAIPWLPKVNLRNPFLAMENGDEFVQFFHRAAEGQENPFNLLVMVRLYSEREEYRRRLLGCPFGTDPATGCRPITTCEWIDRLAPKAWAVVAVGNLRDVRRHSRHGRESHRLHGAAGLSGLGLEIGGRCSDCLHTGLSRAAGQYD